MQKARSAAPAAAWTGGSTVGAASLGYSPETAQGRAFLQTRIGAFARLMLGLTTAYAAFLVAMRLELTGGPRQPVGPAIGAAVAACAVLGFVWFAASRPRLEARTLLALDLLGTLAPAAFIGGTVLLVPELPLSQVGAFVGIALKVFTRTLLVPSNARRSLAFSTIAVAPVLLANGIVAAAQPTMLLAPAQLELGFLGLWSSGLVLVSSYGSGVLYQLRREAAEARRLGQYVLHEKIGEGGMGVVYRAQHALLRRDTAVKLLPPEKAGEENVRRFEREVQHAATLTHPNTIAIYDYGRSTDGTFYYAMELLEGVDLETLVARHGPQPPSRVVHLVAQLCAALFEAHERGFVHRDIKPGNVFLTRRGGVPDVVKVLDFGLVRDFVHGEPGATSAPQTVMGTPAYMAPESIVTPAAVGPPADLYAVGGVAYYLLTGRLAFVSDTIEGLLAQHVQARPEPPSRYAPGPVSAALDALVVQCLAKRPADRPADAATLKRSLERVPEAGSWHEDHAHAWWRAFDEAAAPPVPARVAPSTMEAAATLAVVR